MKTFNPITMPRTLMLQLLSIVTLFIGLITIPAQAAAHEIAGVSLKPAIVEQGKTLKLNGAGIRTKFFIDLYVGSLYTSKPATSAADILSGPNIAAVRLDILSGLITSDRMVSTVQEGFEESTGGKTQPLEERITKFLSVFTHSEIKKGETFTLLSQPGIGVTAYRNGQVAATVKGDDFRKALFGIWLGKKPADAKLKAAMLSGK